VPGVGRLQYGKQLAIATLGLALAENQRLSNIRVANAVEALACLIGYQYSDGANDARLRGRRKLAGASLCTPFKRAVRSDFYVTQPMRMGLAQPLVTLGLASTPKETPRFNSLEITSVGRAFLEVAFSRYRPRNRSVVDHLESWIRGETDRNDYEPLQGALSPLVALSPEAIDIVHDRFCQGPGAVRRVAIQQWLVNLDRESDWRERPKEIDAEHWRDLESGARFFELRWAAFRLLDAVEVHLAERGLVQAQLDQVLRQPSIDDALGRLRACAERFGVMGHAPSNAGDGVEFARVILRESLRDALAHIVSRDGKVLVREDDAIVRGEAFDASAVDRETIAPDEDSPSVPKAGGRLPEWISIRVLNMDLLRLDLNGKLDAVPAEPEVDQERLAS